MIVALKQRRSVGSIIGVVAGFGLLCAAGCSDGGSMTPKTSGLPHVDVVSRTTTDHTADASNRIAAAANEFIYDYARNESTRGLFNASKTNECVAAVQMILARAGIGFAGPTDRAGNPTINVDEFRAALISDPKSWIRYDAVSAAAHAVPGDIWVQGDGHAGAGSGQNHVGICQDLGCAHVVSNSSEKGSFTWSDTIAGYEAFYRARNLPAYPSAVYHRV